MRILYSLLQLFLTLIVVITLTFFALRLLPGDAITTQLIQGGASSEEVDSQREVLGLDRHIGEQYISYMVDAVQGDWGTSLITGLPVVEVILAQLRHTIVLALLSISVATILGIALGVGASIVDFWLVKMTSEMIISLVLSIPVYLSASIMISVVAIQLQLLPITGSTEINNLIMPVSLLAIHVSGSIAKVVQTNLNSVKHATFVLFARSKGLKETHITYRHILRVGLLPAITVVGLQFGYILSGTVVIESIFVRPGVGRLLVASVRNQDYPVVQGIVLVSSCLYLLILAMVDHFAYLVDPRLTST